MSLSTAEEKRILELLKSEGPTTIVLVGKPGSGKTWMARKLSSLASRQDLFDYVLWVFLNRKYDSRALYDSIAHQLCLFYTTRELEVDDNLDIEEVQEEKDLKVLRQKISKALAGKRFLLVLDDEGNKMKEGEVKALLRAPLKNHHKVLITTLNKDDRHKDSTAKSVIKVEPLSKEESSTLLRQRVGSETFRFPGMEQLDEGFVEKIMDQPAAIVIMAKALSYFCKLDSGVQTLEKALKEAFDGENPKFMQLLCCAHEMLPSSILVDCAWRGGHFFGNGGSVHCNELIAYWIMEGYLGRIDSVEKAYEEGHHVLMDLIDCQLLKKVEPGYVTIEGSGEADYIVKERAMLRLDDCRRSGFDGIANLGLVDLFEIGKWGGFGRITQADGMIRTPRGGKKGKKLSTVLLDGNGLCWEVLNDFCESNHELQVLAIFNPTLESLPRTLRGIKQLGMLVLRGCDFLVDIAHIRELSMLTVLEISGTSSLVEMPPDLFKKMTRLQSLNLSSLQIKKLPESFYLLTELHRLLLKDCPNLVELKPLGKCGKLVVLNLSGCTSLEDFQYKNLRGMHKLRTLDLSNTKIKSLPKFHEIEQLTHILLRDCPYIDRLPSIKSLTHLQVLEISGAKAFVEIQDETFERNAALNIIDLSGTPVKKLPSNIGNPCHLYLKGCTALEELPYMEALKDLEALDLSGAVSLKIGEKFFEYLGKLRILNLSETNVKSLPYLPNLSELRELLLSRCSSLVELPPLTNLKKLEVFDLSGCSHLKDIKAESFDQMTCLQRLILSESGIESLPSLSNLIDLRVLLLNGCTKLKVLPSLESLSKLEELNLCSVSGLGETGPDLKNMGELRILNLSDTPLKEIPSMSKIKNLSQLFLRGCKHLEVVPDLKELTKLEVLDLSGTAISRLPSLNTCTNLHQLLLKDCPNLEESTRHEMLDLSGAIIKHLPCGIPELSHLEQLDLPKMVNNQGDDSRKVSRWEEAALNQYQWHISNLPEMLADSDRPFISVSSSTFFELLEKNPSLWESSFKQFHLSVRPVDQKNRGGIHCYRDELVFRGIYFQARCFPYFNEQGRSLEICGCHHLPKGIQHVLSCAEYVFLFDNAFIKDLRDLGAKNIKLMKGCWIERCENMESVFHAKEVGEKLEMLWLSNLLELTSICSVNLHHEGFRNLKHLYLDCCPKLSSVFSSSRQPENLETLQIRFCDNLEALFYQKSGQCILPKLHTLHLWELPKLKSIGCVIPNLHTLIVGECSMLVNVLSPPRLPENLTILQIKGCDNLETVIENSTSADYKLSKLCTLHLSGLPKLKSIGGELPSVQYPKIRDCPKLSTFAVSRQSLPPSISGNSAS